MGARLLLIYVICQTVITKSLGGVTLPFLGKVTPIEPEPLSASTISSLYTSSTAKSSPLRDSEDIMPKLFSPATGRSVLREFSSPLTLTSSSRALPVPKIDSLSIADVKMPERLREKFLPPKPRKAPVKNDKSDIRILPYKYPFLSSPTNLPNTLPTYSSSDMYLFPLNKCSSLPSIKSLPVVLLEPLQKSGTNPLCSFSKRNYILDSTTEVSMLRPIIYDSPLTMEARKPCLEQFATNTLFPLSSSSYPFYYKSMYLPGVNTPSELMPLNYGWVSYKGADNFNIPSQSTSYDLLSPKTLSTDTNLNSLPRRNDPCTLPYFNPIKISEMSKSINTIQLPKTSSNVPFSTKPVFSTQNASGKNHLSPLDVNSVSASVAFESRLEPTKSFIPSFDMRGNNDPKSLLSSLSYAAVADKISDFKLKPCNPPKITATVKASMPFVSLTNQQTCSDFDFSQSNNCKSNIDIKKYCPRNLNIPNIYPVIDAYVETKNPKDLVRNSKPCINFDNVPSLKRVNVPETFNCPLIPSNQHLLLPGECISHSRKCSLPRIPPEPMATISHGASTFSPVSYCPSRTSQTPVTPISYSNVSPPSSIAQSTSKMVSSINNLVSTIAQNMLSSYMSYINSTPQTIPQKPSCATKSNSFDNSGLKTKQTSVLPLLQRKPVNTEPTLSIMSSPINPPAVDTFTILSADAPCPSSAFEIPSSQVLSISSPQPLTAPVLSLTSLINFPSSQLCPSNLPSPYLPSYPTIASPLYMEAPVIKVSTSKKDCDVEKLIELLLIAEILNNDESFDWDDLDTLLAFLSLS